MSELRAVERLYLDKKMLWAENGMVAFRPLLLLVALSTTVGHSHIFVGRVCDRCTPKISWSLGRFSFAASLRPSEPLASGIVDVAQSFRCACWLPSAGSKVTFVTGSLPLRHCRRPSARGCRHGGFPTRRNRFCAPRFTLASRMQASLEDPRQNCGRNPKTLDGCCCWDGQSHECHIHRVWDPGGIVSD